MAYKNVYAHVYPIVNDRETDSSSSEASVVCGRQSVVQLGTPTALRRSLAHRRKPALTEDGRHLRSLPDHLCDAKPAPITPALQFTLDCLPRRSPATAGQRRINYQLSPIDYQFSRATRLQPRFACRDLADEKLRVCK